MSQPNPMSQTGAFWCEEHQRWECCKKSKRTQLRCHASAIRGTATCRNHSGIATELAKAKGEAVTAWSALTGKPVVSTAQAVLGMLQMSWLRAHLYASLLERQFNQAQQRRSILSDEGQEDEGRSRRITDGAPPVGPGVGLIGHTFGAVKDIGIYASGEAIRGLAQLEAAERDRCVKYAKTAHDMAIDEAEQKLAKEQGVLMAEAVRRILDALLTALLGLVTETARRQGEGADQAFEAFTQVVGTAIRSAWPGWLGEIVPRELLAISAEAGQ